MQYYPRSLVFDSTPVGALLAKTVPAAFVFVLALFSLSVSAFAQSEVIIPDVGVIEDAATSSAVRIDRTGNVHTLAVPGFRQQPFAVAPDANRKFTAKGNTVSEIALTDGYPSGTYTVPGVGEVKAMEVHPGGERLIIVLEDTSRPAPTSQNASVNSGITDINDSSRYPTDRISIVSQNISAELGADGLDRSFSEVTVLNGAAYNITDIAISPDGSFALITAMGVSETRATPFGVISGPDELTGGVFKVDLDTMEQQSYIPTALSGENSREMRQSVVSQGIRIKHPLVQIAESNVTTSLGELEVLSSFQSAFNLGGGMSALTQYSNDVYIANLLSKSYQDFGILATYAYTYPFDMVGATGVGISNVGDLAMVTMEKTNNIGVIPFSSYSSSEYGVSYQSSQFGFESALPKQINGENIDWSLDASGAVSNTRRQYWAPADVAFGPSDSKAIVGAYGAQKGRYGVVDLDRDRNVVLSGDPNKSWVAINESDLTYPKHVAGFAANDNDGDGLSNQVEAFNRSINESELSAGDPAKLASLSGSGLADINIPEKTIISESDGSLANYLIPHSGIGYRFNYLGQSKFSVNTGSLVTIAGIEALGQAWNESNPSRPYFIIQSMSQPGGGYIYNRVGDLVDYNERSGFEVNISYFSSGTDEPFDVVPSNGPASPTDNTLASLIGMDQAATFELLDLLIAEDGVKDIWIDPLVYAAYGNHSSKFILRGSVDPENTGRRDCDSFMRVVFGADTSLGVYVGGTADVRTSSGVTHYYDSFATTGEGIPIAFSFSAADFLLFSIEDTSHLFFDKALTHPVSDIWKSGEKYQSTHLMQNNVLYADNPGINVSVSTFDTAGSILDTVVFSSEAVGISLSDISAVVSPPDGDYQFPGWADGFDLDQYSPESLSSDRIDDAADDVGTSIGAALIVRLVVADTDAKVRISYPASAPGAVSRYTQYDGYTPETFFQLPAQGLLRLWKSNSESRNLTDYVAPGVYSISEFAHSSGSFTLYMEAVSDDWQGCPVEVALDPDGDGPAGFIVSDRQLAGDSLLTVSDKDKIQKKITLNAQADHYELDYNEAVWQITDSSDNELSATSYDSLNTPLRVEMRGGNDTDGTDGVIAVKFISDLVDGDPVLLKANTDPLYRIYELKRQPAVMRLGIVDLSDHLQIHWDPNHEYVTSLSTRGPNDPLVNGENQTTVKAIIDPVNRTSFIRYAIAEWIPDENAIVSNQSKPTIDEVDGTIVSGEAKGNLWVYAYDTNIPDVQTKQILIKIGGCDSCTASGSAQFCVGTACNSLHVSIDLGDEGMLLLDAERPNPNLSTPEAIQYSGAPRTYPVYDRKDQLSEIRGENRLFLVKTISEHKYYIEGYFISDLNTPISCVVIENPDPQTYKYGDAIRVSYSSSFGYDNLTYDNADRVDEFRFNASDGSWTLYQGMQQVDTSEQTFLTAVQVINSNRSSITSSVPGDILVKTTQQLGEQGAVLSTTQRTLVQSDVGDLLLENRVIRQGKKDLVSTYDYYPNGYLKSVENYDGSWQKFEYDSEGRISRLEEPFLNATSASSTASKIVTEYGYQPLGEGDTGSLHPDAPRTVEVVINGQRSTQQYIFTQDHTTVINDGLRSTTYWVQEGHFKGRPERIIHPNQSETHYSYSRETDGDGFTRTTTTTVRNGTVNAAYEIVDGTSTTSTSDRYGRLSDTFTSDIASGVVLNAKVATQFDSYGRVTEWAYQDGTTSSLQYSCCGVEWEMDRYGIRTDYTYDALKRLKTRTRLGVTQTYFYDYKGYQTSVTRKGTDGTEQTISRTERDDDNGIIRSFDALDRETMVETTYLDEGGTLTHTVLPSGGEIYEKTAADGRMLETWGSANSPVKYEYSVESLEGIDYQVTKQIRVGDNREETEFTKTFTDHQGRTVREQYADGAFTSYQYNTLGQLTQSTDPDGVVTLYGYNEKGEQEITAIDVDQNGQIDYAGDDRITRARSWVDDDNPQDESVTVSTQEIWNKSGANVPLLVSTTKTSIDGRRSWSTNTAGATTYRETVIPTNPDGSWSVRTVLPDGSQQVQHYENGLLDSTQQLDANDQVIHSLVYGYDEFLRTKTVTDSRTGTTTYTYYADDQIESITAPEPSVGVGSLVTTFYYDQAGRLQRRVLPDNSEEHSEYFENGNLQKQWGSQRYPIEYTYDVQGRLKTQTTWQVFDQTTGTGTSGAAITEWVYDPQRGFLSAKLHADGNGPSYAYTAAGRLLTRTWARGVTTTYAFDEAGQMQSIDYSDATPDVEFVYTRSGQLDIVSDGTLINDQISQSDTRYFYDLAYDEMNQLQAELISTEVDRVLTRHYETPSDTAPGRYLGYDLGSDVDHPQDITYARYGYDAAGRIHTVTAANVNYTYNYLPQSNLIESINGDVHDVHYTYETGRNAMTSITNTTASTTVSEHASRFDKLGRRTDVTRTGIAFALDHLSKYYYDQLGQLTDDQRFEGNSPETPGSQLEAETFSFLYDSIGNRKESHQGNSISTYAANALNQYDGVNNYEPVYDNDGNLLADDNLSYTWNGENRLIKVEPVVATSGSMRAEYAYDYLGRRIGKTVYVYTDGTWTESTSTVFVYDGWNLISSEILNLQSEIQSSTSFVWGLDLSGFLQGAGGVGGLLSQTTSNSNLTETYYYTYDFNGNVSELIHQSGTTAAHYEYGPFGQIVSETYAPDFESEISNFKFSTKYQDSETSLYYYGYRFYDTEIGRWLNRDPIEEEGGVNLYGFIGNDAVNSWDYLGLKFSNETCQWILKSLSYQHAAGWVVPRMKIAIYNKYLRNQTNPDWNAARREFRKGISDDLISMVALVPNHNLVLEGPEAISSYLGLINKSSTAQNALVNLIGAGVLGGVNVINKLPIHTNAGYVTANIVRNPVLWWASLVLVLGNIASDAATSFDDPIFQNINNKNETRRLLDKIRRIERKSKLYKDTYISQWKSFSENCCIEYKLDIDFGVQSVLESGIYRGY